MLLRVQSVYNYYYFEFFCMQKNVKILLVGVLDVMLESFVIYEEEIVNDGGDVEIGEIYSDVYEEFVFKDEEEDMDVFFGMFVFDIF